MKIGTLINNGTINDIHDSQVVVTSEGIHITQHTPESNASDVLCFDNLPDILRSPRAKELWRELFHEGYVDSRCMTTRSRTESAIMAKLMADKLGIKQYWHDFSELWKIPNLKASYGKSHDSQNGWDFEERINRLFR